MHAPLPFLSIQLPTGAVKVTHQRLCIPSKESALIHGSSAGTSGSSFFCMAGLHGAVLALYLLQGDSHDGQQWSFQQLCSMHAPPSRCCHSWDSVSEVEDVPGSLLLLADAGSAKSVQVLHAPTLALHKRPQVSTLLLGKRLLRYSTHDMAKHNICCEEAQLVHSPFWHPSHQTHSACEAATRAREL